MPYPTIIIFENREVWALLDYLIWAKSIAYVAVALLDQNVIVKYAHRQPYYLLSMVLKYFFDFL